MDEASGRIAAAVLILGAQAGLLFWHCGLLQGKSVGQQAKRTLLFFACAIPAFWAVIFGLIHGPSQMGWVGRGEFFATASSTQSSSFFLLQLACMGLFASVVSTAGAERLRLIPLLIAGAVALMFIYPLFNHWTQAGLGNSENKGWLEALGFVDFAGSTRIHSLAAWFCLAANILVGPRPGRFNLDGTSNVLSLPNTLLCAFGVFLLLVSWFGFGLIASSQALLVISLSATTSALISFALKWYGEGEVRAGEFLGKGFVAGLVVVAGGLPYYSPQIGCMLGAAAGVVLVFGSWVNEKMKIDDPVSVIAVHGYCGALGTLAVAWDGSVSLLTQALGVLVGFCFAFAVSMLLFWFLKKTTGLGEVVAVQKAVVTSVPRSVPVEAAVSKVAVVEDVAVKPVLVQENQEVPVAVEDVAVASEQTQERELLVTAAGQVSQIVDEVEKNFSAMNLASNEVAKAVYNLSVQSEEIDRMLDIINSISKQTKLLSVNALIEAERAGNQGRAFGVVAQEVQKLSHGTKESSAEVGRIVGLIHNDLGGLLGKIKEQQQCIDAGVEYLAKAREVVESLLMGATQPSS